MTISNKQGFKVMKTKSELLESISVRYRDQFKAYESGLASVQGQVAVNLFYTCQLGKYADQGRSSPFRDTHLLMA